MLPSKRTHAEKRIILHPEPVYKMTIVARIDPEKVPIEADNM